TRQRSVLRMTLPASLDLGEGPKSHHDNNQIQQQPNAAMLRQHLEVDGMGFPGGLVVLPVILAPQFRMPQRAKALSENWVGDRDLSSRMPRIEPPRRRNVARHG